LNFFAKLDIYTLVELDISIGFLSFCCL